MTEAKKFIRKNSVLIEAMQFKPFPMDNGLTNEGKCIAFCPIARNPIHEWPDLIIPTLRGDIRCEPGDWIIKDMNGEFSICKNEIFQQTYEQVDSILEQAESDQETKHTTGSGNIFRDIGLPDPDNLLKIADLKIERDRLTRELEKVREKVNVQKLKYQQKRAFCDGLLKLYKKRLAELTRMRPVVEVAHEGLEHIRTLAALLVDAKIFDVRVRNALVYTNRCRQILRHVESHESIDDVGKEAV